MKKIIIIIVAAIYCNLSFAQASKDGRKSIMPDSLAAVINGGQDEEILILNTGPVDDIKHAVNIGPVSDEKNVKKLKRYLKNVPRDKEVIIYCGCCPFASCPNINPAYDLLAEMKFTNFKVLRLDEDLKMDWIDKGFPMSNN